MNEAIGFIGLQTFADAQLLVRFRRSFYYRRRSIRRTLRLEVLESAPPHHRESLSPPPTIAPVVPFRCEATTQLVEHDQLVCIAVWRESLRELNGGQAQVARLSVLRQGADFAWKVRLVAVQLFPGRLPPQSRRCLRSPRLPPRAATHARVSTSPSGWDRSSPLHQSSPAACSKCWLNSDPERSAR